MTSLMANRNHVLPMQGLLFFFRAFLYSRKRYKWRTHARVFISNGVLASIWMIFLHPVFQPVFFPVSRENRIVEISLYIHCFNIIASREHLSTVFAKYSRTNNMAESVRKWSTGSLEEKKDTKKITQKKEPQWMTNLLRSKDVSKARLPTLWQQCLYGLLIALNRVQCPFSLLMSISKLPRKASSTFLSDIIFHDFFFPTKWHAWCLFSFQNCKNCVGWNARTQWLHHFFFFHS